MAGSIVSHYFGFPASLSALILALVPNRENMNFENTSQLLQSGINIQPRDSFTATIFAFDDRFFHTWLKSGSQAFMKILLILEYPFGPDPIQHI